MNAVKKFLEVNESKIAHYSVFDTSTGYVIFYVPKDGAEIDRLVFYESGGSYLNSPKIVSEKDFFIIEKEVSV